MEANWVFFTVLSAWVFWQNCQVVNCGLSDFGGDVKQYMSLLQGTSAFSFSPDDKTEGTQKTTL
jgi:hypothetical protein